MNLLVCGDRDWTDRDLLFDVMDGFGNQYLWDFVLVHGAARGADIMAAEWAKERSVPTLSFPAQWGEFGKGAGPIRNRQMLNLGLDLVVAFHDDIRHSKGTRHMVTIARQAEVPVKLIYHQSPSTISGEAR
jgi:hypothetical protein